MSDRPACPATGERCHLDCPADEPPGLCRLLVSVPEATPAEPRAKCCCDGAAYFTTEENAARHPFIVHPGCPFHAAPVVSSPGADSPDGATLMRVAAALMARWEDPSDVTRNHLTIKAEDPRTVASVALSALAGRVWGPPLAEQLAEAWERGRVAEREHMRLLQMYHSPTAIFAEPPKPPKNPYLAASVRSGEQQ